MIKTMQKKMYILGTNTAVGGLNVERLTTVRNITGGCRMEKKNYVLKMKLHFEKTLRESVLFFVSHLLSL